MFIRSRNVEFEASDLRLFIFQLLLLLRSNSRLRFLVGRQRWIVPICAHTALQHTPGLADLGLTARTLARLESLDAHANAVQVRLDAITRGAG